MNKKYKHIPSGKVFTNNGNGWYVVEGSNAGIPPYIVGSGKDWEEIKENTDLLQIGQRVNCKGYGAGTIINYPKSLNNGNRVYDYLIKVDKPGRDAFYDEFGDVLYPTGTCRFFFKTEVEPVKDYTILSFYEMIEAEKIIWTPEDGEINSSTLFSDNEKDKYEGNGYNIARCISVGLLIYSVRRESDGEVFTIRDKHITQSGEIEAINMFLLSNSKIQVYFKSENLIKTYSGNLDTIKSYEDPILILESGKGVFDKTTIIYPVHKDLFERSHEGAAIYWENSAKSKYFFLSREEAEDFIAENKPKYSLKDIKNVLKHHFHHPNLIEDLIDLKK